MNLFNAHCMVVKLCVCDIKRCFNQSKCSLTCKGLSKHEKGISKHEKGLSDPKCTDNLSQKGLKLIIVLINKCINKHIHWCGFFVLASFLHAGEGSQRNKQLPSPFLFIMPCCIAWRGYLLL